MLKRQENFHDLQNNKVACQQKNKYSYIVRLNLLIFFCSLFLLAEVQASSEYSSPEIEFYKNSLISKRRRTDLINYLIAVNGYQSYLEIGVAGCDNFKEIIVERKKGVDPYVGCIGVVGMTSDDFFANQQETFDIVFIDGLHLSEQVLQDVNNSLKVLNKGGVIVMHDCMPTLEIHQNRNPTPGGWTGDVWKTVAFIRMNYKDIHFCVLETDWGCGILTPDSSQSLFPQTPMENLTWEFYQQNKVSLLNLKSIETWLLEQREQSKF